MIQIENLTKIYKGIAGEVLALDKVNAKINPGENIVIIGKSGSGKSTLLNLLSGIDRPTSGKIEINGVDLNSLSEGGLASWRGKNVGIVFQFYQLLPTLNSLDNILFSMALVNKISSNHRRKKALRHLEEVGLGSKYNKFPNELSGGERQRVAIARSMANDPGLIIADEPTGNLDSKTGMQINDLFRLLNRQGTTLITVTHATIKEEEYNQVFAIEDGKLSQVNQNIVLS